MSHVCRVPSEGCDGLDSHWLICTIDSSFASLRGDREGRRALDHVGVEGRAIIGAPRPLHGVQQLVGVEEVGDDGLHAQAFEPLAPGVSRPHDGPDGPALLAKLGGDGASGLAGGARDEDGRSSHGNVPFDSV